MIDAQFAVPRSATPARLALLPDTPVVGASGLLAEAKELGALFDRPAPALTQPRLRLLYLDIKGLAEPIRLALSLSGYSFEDARLSYEDVAALRATGALPFGQVPVLEIDGVPHAQAGALLRWAGGGAGLYPARLQLQIDAALELLSDVRTALRPAWYGSALGRHPITGALFDGAQLSAGQRACVAESLNDAILPTRFAQLEAALRRSGGPYLCGEQVRP